MPIYFLLHRRVGSDVDVLVRPLRRMTSISLPFASEICEPIGLRSCIRLHKLLLTLNPDTQPPENCPFGSTLRAF